MHFWRLNRGAKVFTSGVILVCTIFILNLRIKLKIISKKLLVRRRKCSFVLTGMGPLFQTSVTTSIWEASAVRLLLYLCIFSRDFQILYVLYTYTIHVYCKPSLRKLCLRFLYTLHPNIKPSLRKVSHRSLRYIGYQKYHWAAKADRALRVRSKRCIGARDLNTFYFPFCNSPHRQI